MNFPPAIEGLIILLAMALILRLWIKALNLERRLDREKIKNANLQKRIDQILKDYLHYKGR